MIEPEYQKEIIRKLANKYNKTYEEVHDIYYFQFKFVNKVIRMGNFAKILINGFGSWSVKQKRLEIVNAYGKAKSS